MARYNIYLKGEIEKSLSIIFEYLKSIGDIPANATEIGEYRAQCIGFAVHYTLGGIAEELPELGVNRGETS